MLLVDSMPFRANGYCAILVTVIVFTLYYSPLNFGQPSGWSAEAVPPACLRPVLKPAAPNVSTFSAEDFQHSGVRLPEPQYFAEYGIDKNLDESYFKCQPRGIFVEIGASDGFSASNTKYFEEQCGWDGVLIEAHPKTCEKLHYNRPFAIKLCQAVCEQRGQIEVIGRGSMVSGVQRYMKPSFQKRFHPRPSASERHLVPCDTFGAMLKMINVPYIDLLSVDVEGMEGVVLNTFAWGDIPVRVLVVEMDEHSDLTNNKISEMLIRHGLVFQKYIGPNAVFINDTYHLSTGLQDRGRITSFENMRRNFLLHRSSLVGYYLQHKGKKIRVR